MIRGAAMALCLLATAGVASAQSVAVLGLSSEDGNDEMARALTRALRERAAEASPWTLTSAQPSLTQMTLAHDCEIADAACRARIGEGLGASYVVYGNTSGSPMSGTVHVELMLYESAAGDILGVAARDIPQSDAAGGLEPHAAALLDELRGVRAPAEEEPDVGQADDPSADAEIEREVPPQDVADEGGGSSMAWLGYSLLGVAAVSTGLAVYSWTQIDSAADDPAFEQYRVAVGRADPGIEDVCEEADANRSYGDMTAAELRSVQDTCDTGRRFEILQYVFVGAALVSGGVGAYVLLSDESPRESAAASGPRLAVTPRVGVDSVAVQARLRF